MQRYQPPHQRQRGVSTQLPSRPDIAQDPQPAPGFGTHTAASSSNSYTATRGTVPSRGGWGAPRHASTSYRSTKDWSAPILASPSSDLRPVRSGTPGRRKGGGGDEMDEMELMQSVSRSGGDGAEGDALKDWETQERYRGYIKERIDKHHATFGTAPDSIPTADTMDELQSLKSIVLLLRKLREGVVASHRIDDFAIEVFETSVRLSILARDPPQLISSLSGLVPGLYAAVDDKKGKGRAVDPDEQLESTLAKLALEGPARGSSSGLKSGDSRVEFASILLLYHLAHGDSIRTFFTTLQSLTSPSSSKLQRPLDRLLDHAQAELPGDSIPSAAFCDTGDLWYALRASRALREDTFNPLLYFSLLSEPKVSVYERAVLFWADSRVRTRAWAVMRKAYLECRLDWIGKWLGKDEAGVASWVEAEGQKVIDGKVSMR